MQARDRQPGRMDFQFVSRAPVDSNLELDNFPNRKLLFSRIYFMRQNKSLLCLSRRVFARSCTKHSLRLFEKAYFDGRAPALNIRRHSCIVLWLSSYSWACYSFRLPDSGPGKCHDHWNRYRFHGRGCTKCRDNSLEYRNRTGPQDNNGQLGTLFLRQRRCGKVQSRCHDQRVSKIHED